MKNKSFSKFQILANTSMIIWSVIVILPFLLLLLSSLTDENTLIAYGYSFFPRKFSLDAYKYIINSGEKILRAYGVSIFVTFVGTLGHVFLAALMAYPLSIKKLPGRNIMAFFVFFTMLFNGGIVPTYLMYTNIFHIKDTIWAQIFPYFFLNAWNIMIIRTYFTNTIPDALYEAAEIDGASQFTVFRHIVLPIGKPILITVGTFAGILYWNNWTNGLYFIVRNKNLFNIQNLLNQMITNIQFLASSTDSNISSAAAAIPSTAIQMAIAFVAILPIAILFPFFQKYYSKGLIIGSIKG